MANSEWEKRLKKLKEGWSNAKEEAKKGFSRLDDGYYIAVLTGASLGESKSGRFQVTWEWTVAEGDSEGEQTRDFDGLETDQNLTFLCRKLARMGVDVDSFSITGLPAVLDELVEMRLKCRIQLKTKGEFQNLYLDRVLETSDAPADEDDEDDEDEPPAKPAKKEKAPKASKPAPESEPEEDEDEDDDEGEEDVELQVGMKVSYTYRDEEETGTVTSIDEDNGLARIENAKGRKRVVAVDELTVVPEGKDA